MKMRAALWQSVRLVLAAVIAWVFCFYFPSSQGYWIVITALLGLQVSYPYEWRQKLLILFCVGMIGALLGFVSSVISSQILLLVLLLFITTLFTICWGVKHAMFWGAAFAVNFFVLLSAGLHVDVHGSIERFFCMLLGMMIAMLMQVAVSPTRAVYGAKFALVNCLYGMAALTESIFYCYVARDYREKHFYYEKRLHEQRNAVLYEMGQVRYFLSRIKSSDKQTYLDYLAQVEIVYEIILALGELLLRVGDHSTFEVAGKEFVALAEKITSNLKKLAKGLEGHVIVEYQSLSFCVEQFEEVYRSALQVVSQEPMVFLLFVHELRDLDFVLLGFAERVFIRKAVC